MQTDAAAASLSPHRPPAPPLAALAGWLVPGGGYWIIGQRARAITVFVTIVLLYVGGLLLGGIRILDVPYFDKLGHPVPNATLLSEVRSKPWSVAQVMTGPLGLVSGYFAVAASGSDPANEKLGQEGLIFPDLKRSPLNPPRPYGVESHARVNEIAVLYTAVAGMLNLLTMIDAAHRAEKLSGSRSGTADWLGRMRGANAGAAR